jgi:hypothetical protein
MYFKQFPKLIYDFSTNSDQNIKYVTDFLHRVKITAKMVENTSAYQKYIIRDGETAEIISHRLYGTPLYHWTILLANDITNPYNDFPKSTKLFDEYMISKYGQIGQYETHHYEDENGLIITPIAITGLGNNCIYNQLTNSWELVNLMNYKNVTNFDFEFQKNESKRVINIIKPEFIGGVVKTFEDMMKQ